MPHTPDFLQKTENEGKAFLPVFQLNVAMLLLRASLQSTHLESMGHAVWLVASSCNYLENPLQLFCPLPFAAERVGVCTSFVWGILIPVAIYLFLFNQVSFPFGINSSSFCLLSHICARVLWGHFSHIRQVNPQYFWCAIYIPVPMLCSEDQQYSSSQGTYSLSKTCVMLWEQKIEGSNPYFSWGSWKMAQKIKV